MLTFDRVTKLYGPVIGVNNVSCRIGPGITGLLGANGAGKSTMLKLASGQLRPTMGAVTIGGRPAWSAAAKRSLGYSPDINSFYEEMTGREWGILLFLAVIWGGAFLFIGVAVRHVDPLTYVWARLTIAAGGMFLFLKFKGEKLGLPRHVWGSILLLALLNNALPFTLFGWGQTHIASGLASILNATTPIWGVLVAHFFTQDERMTPSLPR